MNRSEINAYNYYKRRSKIAAEIFKKIELHDDRYVLTKAYNELLIKFNEKFNGKKL
jgi:hypothetical protein